MINIDLIEAIDNAKVDSDIAVAESMIMYYDKQLLFMEYDTSVDIFQEGKIMDDVKEQGKGQTKAQKILTFIPRLLKAIFKALTGKLSKVGDSAKKVAEASKKVPAEANKKIANAFNKGDKKGLSSALKAILMTTASLGFGILLTKFARKCADKIFYLEMRWKHLKENPQHARDDKTDKLIMKIMPILTKLEKVGKNDEKLDNKDAENIIKDVSDIVEIISDEKDAPKVDVEYKKTLTETATLFTNLQKDCKANDDTKKDKKPKHTEEKKPESDNNKKDKKPAEQKPDIKESSDDKDSKAVDAFVERVLTDEIKGLLNSGLLEIKTNNNLLEFHICVPHAFILEYESWILNLPKSEEQKQKHIDELKNIINNDDLSNLKNIANTIGMNLGYWRFSITDNRKTSLLESYQKATDDIQDMFPTAENREGLLNDYKVILDKLYKLSLRYLTTVNNVIDEFDKYFLNIDKDVGTEFNGTRVIHNLYGTNKDVEKHMEMIDKAVNKS